jgi:hypothetical protein
MDELRKCCGLEAYLYLTFVRRSANFFGFVSLFTVCTLIPTYSLGITNEEKLNNSLEQYTLLNAIGKPMKMWIVFTVTIIIGISGHLFVYFFQSNIESKKSAYEEKNKLSVSENTIRRHTLLITGINNEL